jgi:hypothetical protein
MLYAVLEEAEGAVVKVEQHTQKVSAARSPPHETHTEGVGRSLTEGVGRSLTTS